jgi:hypothetical protein
MKHLHRWGTIVLALCTTTAMASVGGGGGVVTVSSSTTYAMISGEIQTTSGRFSNSGVLTLANQASFDGADVSAFVDVTQGVLGGSAQALPTGVSTATARFRNQSVVEGAVAGGQANLHVAFDPTMTWVPGSVLNPNNHISLNVSYRTASTLGGIEFNIWADPTGGCGAAFFNGHAGECPVANGGPRAYDIQFDLPTAGNWLSIESDFWLQAIDGTRVGFRDGVHLSLTMPQGVSLVSPLGAFPVTSAVPELSVPANVLVGGLIVLLVARRRR